MHEPVSEGLERLAAVVVDSALCVHRALGPGLLESVYEICLCHELAIRGIAFERQVEIPITYRDIQLEAGLRVDLIVGGQLIVELKAVAEHNALFEAQILSYLKLTDKRLGLLINFHVPLLKDGIKRLIL